MPGHDLVAPSLELLVDPASSSTVVWGRLGPAEGARQRKSLHFRSAADVGHPTVLWQRRTSPSRRSRSRRWAGPGRGGQPLQFSRSVYAWPNDWSAHLHRRVRVGRDDDGRSHRRGERIEQQPSRTWRSGRPRQGLAGGSMRSSRRPSVERSLDWTGSHHRRTSACLASRPSRALGHRVLRSNRRGLCQCCLGCRGEPRRQLAKLRGASAVVGSAGSAAKAEHIVSESSSTMHSTTTRAPCRAAVCPPARRHRCLLRRRRR